MLSTLCLAYSGCISRGEIRAHLWLNNGMPAGICEREPGLRQYGFYRRLNSGKFELISYCKPEARAMVAMPERDLEEILNKTLPKEK